MRPFALGSFVGLVLALTAGSASAVAEVGTPAPSPAGALSGSLVLPSIEQLVGPESEALALKARRLDPGAVSARRHSRDAYRGLGANAAASLARSAFPSVVATSHGAPALAGGERITHYLSENTASVDLGHGHRGVIESSVPIGALTSEGRPVALDLSLRHQGDGYAPTLAAAPLLAHAHADEGVTLASSGLSIAPVGAGSAGLLDGGVVLYANTQTDADTLVKPEAQGLALDAVLRSAASPERLLFAVSGPGSVGLKQDSSGMVWVSLDGDLVAAVQPPSARDAAGTPVPVKMSVAGERLVLDVPHRAGDFHYPIEVDPNVTDAVLFTAYASNWGHDASNEKMFYVHDLGTALVDEGLGYTVGNWGAWGYETQGVSKIYSFGVETASSDAVADIENRVLIAGPSTGIEAQTVLPANYGVNWTAVSAAGSAGNAAEFGQWATSTGGSFTSSIYRTEVMISQTTAPTVSADTTDTTLEGKTNVAQSGGWLGGTSVFGVKSYDPGIGISEVKYRSPQAPGKEVVFKYLSDPYSCHGVQCLQQRTESMGAWWPDGKDKVEVTGSNSTHGDTTTTMEVKVDNTAPHDLAITGLPANAELGDGVYKLEASASDGAGAVPSSGVAPLSIAIDGKAFGSPQGGCSVGPCSTSGQWTISGSQFAVGQHQLVLTGTDYAGNKATKEMAIFVTRTVTPQGVGPGAVNPESGEFTVQASDISIPAPGGALTVGRSFGSQHLTAGATGPLGPAWSLEVGGAEMITKLPTGIVLLGDPGGLQSVFTPKAGGEYTPPKGDENLKLIESTVEGKVQFQLSSNNGAVTTFTLPAGGTGNTWVPTSEAGPNKTNVTTFSYQVVGSVIEPTEVLAPVPANVTCTTTLVKGCRALRFVYAASTTATGEGATEWGDYTGRLKQVTFTAWNPSTSAMVTTTVVQYSYDKLGRLRAEWDPRVTPLLRTTYGYDSLERVTSLVTVNEQPWLLAYGTAPGDIRTGHLLTATRPTPTAAAGPGITPQNTVLPALSSTNAPEGKTITVGTGTWSNTPLAYSYQWQECQTVSGAEVCAPLPGETNASYYSLYHGPNRWLKALVTAVNANGAATVATVSTNVVLANSYMSKSGEFAAKGTGNGQLSGPSAIATDKAGNVWVADTANNRVEKFSSTGTFLATYGTVGSGEGQFKAPQGIAIDNTDRVWVSDTGNTRVEALTSTGAYNGSFATAAAPGAIAVLPVTGGLTGEQAVSVAEGSQIMTYSGVYTPIMVLRSTIGGAGTGNGQFSGVGGLATEESSPGYQRLYATDLGNHRVEVFTGGVGPTYLSQYGTSGTGEGHLGGPQGLDVQAGNVFVADKTNLNVQKFFAGASLGTYTEAAGVYGIATYPKNSNGSMYVLNQTTGKVSKWVTGTRPAPPAPTPPKPGTNSVWTVEYGVPLSGGGVPYAMTAANVANWGQTDAPVEAMAIFPPDSPQGWPATSYTRAGLSYLDSEGRTVNTITPGTSISTTEYNSKNDVVRSLTPDNREKALSEGAKSAEVSHLLDTQSVYSEDGSELLSMTGPQHTVKLASGSQVLARHKTKYFYDEGAPGTGGPYHLATKLTEGALLVGGTEEDVHTTVNSYSGQENLGWKLHVPTSITTDPTGLKLVRTKLYDPVTGYTTDAINPGGNPAGGDSHDSQTIYYSALANAKVPACGLHPEWANLPCQTKLAKNPGTAGVPDPPVTTQTYDMWDAPIELAEVTGTDSRKVIHSYDAAGRISSVALTATKGTALPTVKYGYDSASGAQTTTSYTEGATTRTITSEFDGWGNLKTYKDADGGMAGYTYDTDGRTSTSEDGKGTQSYIYGGKGSLETLSDSAVGIARATYDTEGNIATELLPGGLEKKFTRDATGQVTGLEYVKTTSCASKCTWYSDTVVPSITGQWLSRSSTLSSQNYKYDNAARLTQVQDTPAGLGCTTKIYGYDSDTNLASQTTRVPGAGGVCATEGGTIVSHTYDPADRLIDTGATYDAFGDTTSLPAADAGGTTLSSTYYANGRVASQTQNGQTNASFFDPQGRERETVATGKTVLTSVLHYKGDMETPAWIAEGASGWTRNIQGISGTMVATQANGEAPILQITNLHGDVVATAPSSTEATGLTSTNDTTEYGVPRTSSPPKYSWLGGSGRVTSLASGVVNMGARSYIPQIGRFLQDDPAPGGSANAYGYAAGDPVNNSDPSGEWTSGLSNWLHSLNQGVGQQVVTREAQREAAARAEAEAAAAAAAEPSEATSGEWEYGDPTHVWDLSAHQAEVVANFFESGGKVGEEAVKKWLKLPGEAIAVLLAWVTGRFVSELRNCAGVQIAGDGPRARCRVTLHTVGATNIFTGSKHDTWAPMGFPTIEPCYWFKKASPWNKRGLECYPNNHS